MALGMGISFFYIAWKLPCYICKIKIKRKLFNTLTPTSVLPPLEAAGHIFVGETAITAQFTDGSEWQFNN